MENKFEKASKQKLRFSSTQGHLTTEDLWDLSLDKLDKLAVSIDDEIKGSGTKTFLDDTKKTTATTTLELKLEILKHIIDVRQKAKEASKVRAEKAARVAQLKNLLAQKNDEELKGLTKEEIQKLIEAES